MRCLLPFLAVAVLGLAACGDDSEPLATDASPATTKPEAATSGRESATTSERAGTTNEEPTGADKFSGQDKINYEIGEEVCGAFPPRKVASDLGLEGNRGRTSEELVEIAEKFAEGYIGSFRQAAFEGCLAGLPDAKE